MKKFDPTKPVQTRDGRAARILCSNVQNLYSIIAAVEEREMVMSFLSDGRSSSERVCNFDLVNVPTKVVKTFWINVYPEHENSVAHRSEDAARRNRLQNCVATVPIQVIYEEGEGL